MSARLLIDSDVLIDYLRGEPKAADFLDGRSETLLISCVSIAELFSGVREGNERKALNTFLLAFEAVPIDTSVAGRGGLYRREFSKTHGTGLADALIAASAVEAQARLVTLNTKHFPMLPDALVPYRKA